MSNLKKLFREAIARMVAQRADLDKRIKAMEQSYRLFSPEPDTAPKKAAKKRYKKERTLDPKATEKTLAFIKSRKRPTRPEAVEREFNLTRAAATQRLLVLVKRGMAKRVGLGRYVALVHKAQAQVQPS